MTNRRIQTNLLLAKLSTCSKHKLASIPFYDWVEYFLKRCPPIISDWVTEYLHVWHWNGFCPVVAQQLQHVQIVADTGHFHCSSPRGKDLQLLHRLKNMSVTPTWFQYELMLFGFILVHLRYFCVQFILIENHANLYWRSDATMIRPRCLRVRQHYPAQKNNQNFFR